MQPLLGLKLSYACIEVRVGGHGLNMSDRLKGSIVKNLLDTTNLRYSCILNQCVGPTCGP